MPKLDLTRLTDEQYKQYLRLQEWSSTTAQRYYSHCIGELEALETSERTALVLEFVGKNPGLKLSEILERLRDSERALFSRADLRYSLDQLCDRNLCYRYRKGNCLHYEVLKTSGRVGN